MVFMLGACSGPADRASHPYVSEQMRAQFGTVAVVTAPPLSADEIETPPYPGEAILDGVLWGALKGGSAIGGGGGGGVVLLALVLVMMPVGAVMGGVTAGTESLPAEQIDQSKVGIAAGVMAARQEPSLAARIHNLARAELGEKIAPRFGMRQDAEIGLADMPGLGGVDTVLELSDEVLLLTGAGGGDVDPRLRLSIETRLRMLRVADREVLYEQRRIWDPYDSHTFAEWAAEDGRLLRIIIERGRDVLAREMVEDLLLIYHDYRARAADLTERRGETRLFSDFLPLPPETGVAWGFAPISPPREQTPSLVDSLQPAFVWQPFPGRVEVPPPEGEGPTATVPFVPVDVARVERVTYELRISADDELVYQRRGIAEPRLRLDRPLRPGTQYRWAVRAWFELDGETRVSEWGRSMYRERGDIVRRNRLPGFYFKTPGEAPAAADDRDIPPHQADNW